MLDSCTNGHISHTLVSHFFLLATENTVFHTLS